MFEISHLFCNAGVSRSQMDTIDSISFKNGLMELKLHYSILLSSQICHRQETAKIEYWFFYIKFFTPHFYRTLQNLIVIV